MPRPVTDPAGQARQAESELGLRVGSRTTVNPAAEPNRSASTLAASAGVRTSRCGPGPSGWRAGTSAGVRWSVPVRSVER